MRTEQNQPAPTQRRHSRDRWNVLSIQFPCLIQGLNSPILSPTTFLILCSPRGNRHLCSHTGFPEGATHCQPSCVSRHSTVPLAFRSGRSFDAMAEAAPQLLRAAPPQLLRAGKLPSTVLAFMAGHIEPPCWTYLCRSMAPIQPHA